MRNVICCANEVIGDDNVNDSIEWFLWTRLVTLDSKFIVSFNVNVGAVLVLALEPFSALGNGIDTIRVNENTHLRGHLHVLRPHIVDGDRNFLRIHVVDLDHVRTIFAHV